MDEERDGDGVEDILKKLYYNKSSLAYFGNAHDLLKEAKTKIPKVTLKKITEWLRKQDVYNRHKPIKKILQRDEIRADGPFTHCMLDLIDFSKLGKQNSNRKYVFLMVDNWSKLILCIPQMTKSPDECVKSLKEILKTIKPYRPWYFTSDRGKEYSSPAFQKFLYRNLYGHYYSTSTEIKASAAERAVRSVKTRIAKVWTHADNRNWMSPLKSVVTALNNQKKRALNGLTPIEVLENPTKLKRKMISYPKHTFNFKVGDKVRIVKERGTFQKSYMPGWTTEVFVISKLLKHRKVPCYKITALNGEYISGISYENDLTLS